MTEKEAIKTIQNNWPDSHYTMLTEALGMAIKALANTEDTSVCYACGRVPLKKRKKYEGHLE